ARRQTVFTALYYADGETLTEVKKETNIPMKAWLEELKALNEEVILMSPHMEVFSEIIEDEDNEQLRIAPATIHLPRQTNLIVLQKNQDAAETHGVAPNYLRITEAEAKWLANQKGVSHEG